METRSKETPRVVVEDEGALEEGIISDLILLT
jgi:hypothetical protein